MRISLKYWIAGGVLILFNIVVYTIQIFLPALLPPALLSWTSTLLPVACALLGVLGLIGAFTAFKFWDVTKTAWFLLMLGIASSGIAEGIYFVMKMFLGMNPDDIIPSVADCFWMISYIPVFISFLMLVNGYRKSGFPFGDRKKYFVAILGAFAVAVGIVVWVLIPIFSDPGTEWLAKAIYTYYPFFDFLVLVPALILILVTMQFGKGSLSIPWKLIALGFLCWSAADIAYSMLSWQGLYTNGNFIDLLWSSSYLLMGAAGLFQRTLLRSVEKGGPI